VLPSGVVKTLRIWLLLLLAVLLPLRGAVAAGMLCPMGSQGDSRTEAVVFVSLDRHADPVAAGHHHQHADHDRGESAHHDQGHDGAADKCNLCVAFCSVTPMLSELPTVAPPLQTSTLRFPSYAATPPSFFSDGEERPPRSI